MKVFMIGGTGLLGSVGAKELIKKGHEVVTLSLPDIPKDADLPKEMKIITGNYLTISDQELEKLMTGVDVFIFAAGVDDRVESEPPIYDLYKKFNNDPLFKMIEIAKKVGVKKAIVLGSYFTYFDREWRKLHLREHNPYIRARVEQEETSLSYADDNFSVGVLELPYIFGTQKGRRPVWTVIVEQINQMKDVTMYPPGGTTMVTVKQVGEAICGAALKTEGAVRYPVGYYNMEWKELIPLFHKYMDQPEKPFKTIPAFLFRYSQKNAHKKALLQGREAGLDMFYFGKAMSKNMFIDKKWMVDLGVQEDDIESAIKASVEQSVKALKGEEMVEMKAIEK